jgi:hypothetical protein
LKVREQGVRASDSRDHDGRFSDQGRSTANSRLDLSRLRQVFGIITPFQRG